MITGVWTRGVSIALIPVLLGSIYGAYVLQTRAADPAPDADPIPKRPAFFEERRRIMLVNGKWTEDWQPVQAKDEKGGFVRQISSFRNWITPDGNAFR